MKILLFLAIFVLGVVFAEETGNNVKFFIKINLHKINVPSY